MRAITIMFDTLSRKYLENYGCDWVHTPNFKRLEKHCCKFENFYAGSMPCIPARRELHTGKYNYMHRSWGPLEPFDFSCIEELKNNGIYCHLITDHSHYFEDGGATYHNRFNTWEGFRGQEGDRWMPQSYGNIPNERNKYAKTGISVIQNFANKTKVINEEDYSSVKVFNSGIEFIEKHMDKDDWFLQIEIFDPHEPFNVPDRFRKLYGLHKDPTFNWPIYGWIDDAESIDILRKEYASLISMCDYYLGKVLDLLDKYDMWKDTMVMVNTDHGFLLGEHNFSGKNFGPLYNEISLIPFFIHVPDMENGIRNSLSQTIDIAPTLIDYFNIDSKMDFDGKSLLKVVKNDKKIRDLAYFGIHGSYNCATDGRMVYMHGNINSANQPLVECTLIPTRMRGFFNKKELKSAELCKGDSYSNFIPYLKIPVKSVYNTIKTGNQLFDLKEDPAQNNNLINKIDSTKYKDWIIRGLKKYNAPIEEFERLGLYK